MPDVLIIGDTERMADLRHEVPVQITRSVRLRRGRRAAADRDLQLRDRPDPRGGGRGRVPPDGALQAGGGRAPGAPTPTRSATSSTSGSCVTSGSRARRAALLPLGVADHLRANGIELEVDQRFFDDRRRVKSDPGAGRHPPGPEGGGGRDGGGARAAAASGAANGGYSVDGEELTCELVKQHVERAFAGARLHGDDFIVSHGPQTAVGHDMGHGAIADRRRRAARPLPGDRESACFADMTRTFVVGTAPESCATTTALQGGARLCVGAIRPGLDGKELHRRSRTSSPATAPDAADEAGGLGARGRLLPRDRPRGRPRGARAAGIGRSASRSWRATCSRSSRASTATASAACGSRISCSSRRTAARCSPDFPYDLDVR